MKKALWFSGGKDSMACLFLNAHRLDEICVIYADTGRYYPEQHVTVQKAKEMCPHWVQINTDRDGQWKEHGLPSDIVPMDWTRLGQSTTHKKETMVQDYLRCCWENISGPVFRKTKELGCTTVIRGQRADESHRAPAKDGDIYEGIKFEHPIENWTREEVIVYLSQRMEIPEHYALDHSSMDCYDCTAFAAHSLDRVAFMKKKHPLLYTDYKEKLGRLHAALLSPMRDYERLINA